MTFFADAIAPPRASPAATAKEVGRAERCACLQAHLRPTAARPRRCLRRLLRFLPCRPRHNPRQASATVTRTGKAKTPIPPVTRISLFVSPARHPYHTPASVHAAVYVIHAEAGREPTGTTPPSPPTMSPRHPQRPISEFSHTMCRKRSPPSFARPFDITKSRVR